MISHSIIKYKPRVVHHTPPISNQPINRSPITSQYLLDSFLADKPTVGQWVYRNVTAAHSELPLRSNWQLSYVLGVEKTFNALTKFAYSSGWPETHELITFYPPTEESKAAGRHPAAPWRRHEDIRFFKALTKQELETFLDDQLQDCLKNYLAAV